MRRSLFLSCLFFSLAASAQSVELPASSLKASLALAHDYPGMEGTGGLLEYNFPLNEWLQGGVGLKRIQITGHPNTPLVEEFTRSTTLDFNLMVIALQQGPHALKLGAGYSFCFYSLRRTYAQYPGVPGTVVVKDPNWIVVDENSRTGGMSLLGEYEWRISSGISAGARISLAKAYARHILLAGPFIAVSL
jgi:hypothetical protein